MPSQDASSARDSQDPCGGCLITSFAQGLIKSETLTCDQGCNEAVSPERHSERAGPQM